MQIVINGDNLVLLKDYPDNHFDSVVTDPPYGLGKEPDAVELMKDWIEKGYYEISGSGFMGKEWDAFVPQPQFWKEVFRVLKPGGHVLAFFGTRTYDWGVIAMRFAGFEVRDCIQWLYGSGFPKSHNISKAIDKIYGAERKVIKQGYGKGQAEAGYRPADYVSKQLSNEAITEYPKIWDGWGSALKPANEPIVLARKPLEKGLSIAENVLKWGTGGINIDGCRVGTTDDLAKNYNSIRKSDDEMGERGYKMGFRQGKDSKADATESTSLGRFPANIILTHHPECECKGLKKVGLGKEGGYNYEGSTYDVNGFVPKNSPQANSNYGQEIVEDWNCHPDCPIKILDEQSGVLKSTGAIRKKNTDTKPTSIDYKHPKGELSNPYAGEFGGASRFFYVAKASKSERNSGLDQFDEKFSASAEFRPNHMEKAIEGESGNPYGRWSPIKNFHPTVKPVKLMQYLVRLVTPPNGKVLDPFCGSGTTGIACKLEGFEFVGLEQDPEYVKIAHARIENYVEEREEQLKFLENEPEKQQQLNLF